MGYVYTRKPPERPKAIEDIEPALSMVPMLQYARPEGTGAQDAFTERFLIPLGVYTDGCRNVIKRIGNAPVLWSSHTDTVARKPGRQDVDVDDFFAKLAKKDQRGYGTCLGGDDTVGVWIMTEMIRRGVSGLYIFHRGEERGCIGSTYIAKNSPGLLKGIKYAIALDRRGYDSIITKMGSSRTCSESFANAMADQLGYVYRPDPTGSFTDTVKYTDLVDECTNLAVGYHDSHSDNESVDLRFATAVLDRVCTLDISKLNGTRKAGDPGYERSTIVWGTESDVRHWDYTRNRPPAAQPDVVRHPAAARSTSTVRGFLSEPTGKPVKRGPWQPDDALLNPEADKAERSTAHLQGLCEEFPEIAADILEQMGYSVSDFIGHIQSCFGKGAFPQK